MEMPLSRSDWFVSDVRGLLIPIGPHRGCSGTEAGAHFRRNRIASSSPQLAFSSDHAIDLSSASLAICSLVRASYTARDRSGDPVQV